MEAPDGTTWDPVVERSEQWEDVDGRDVLSVWERFVTYPEDSPGEYEISITVEDEFEGERLRTEETFRLESGDAGENGEHDREAHPFGVDRFVYTTERVRRYGEFTEQPQTSYREGEMIWMYLELSNVTPVADGPHLDTTWEFLAPDGEVLGSTTEPIRIPAEPEQLPNETFITQGVDPSAFDPAPSGEYTNEVAIADVGSGETTTVSKPVTVRRFEFDSVAFLDEKPDGPDEYEQNEDATYAAGEDPWVRVALKNVPVDDSGKAVLEFTYEVERPDGSTWEPTQTTQRWERVQDDEILLYSRELVTFDDDPLGTYELTITVEDKVDGRQIRTTSEFSLERRGSAHL